MSLKGITIETAPEKEAHINASDDRAIWEAVIGMDGVIDVGEKLRGELITNNQFRIYDGALAVGGAIGRIPFGEYEDVVIENGTQNQYRNDFVVAQIEANTSVEEMKIVYIKGVPGETAEDPEYISGNIYKNETCRQYPLYRIKLNGLNVESVEPLFNVIVGIKKIKEELEQLNANIDAKVKHVLLQAESKSIAANGLGGFDIPYEPPEGYSIACYWATAATYRAHVNMYYSYSEKMFSGAVWNDTSETIKTGCRIDILLLKSE